MGKHFFKSLKVENFRGLRNCEINDFAKINLFVGKNNCGKTTVLESLFLLSGISNPDLMIIAQNLRGIALSEPNDIKDFFFEQKEENVMYLAGTQETTERKLTVNPYYRDTYVDQTNGSKEKQVSRTKAAESRLDKDLSGLEYEFSVSTGRSQRPRKYNSRTIMEWNSDRRPPQTQLSLDKRYKEKLVAGGKFITQRGGMAFDPVSVDKMLGEKRKDVLLKSAQVIEPKIQDIKVGPTGVVSVDIGYDRFIPLSLLGDGLLNIVNIVSTIDAVSDGILMIDEIGAGLHVSCIKHLWKILVEQSRKCDTQMFITTHSCDVIQGLVEFHEQKASLFSEDEGVIACFYLNKDDEDQVKGYRYSPEQVRQILESGTDIRH